MARFDFFAPVNMLSPGTAIGYVTYSSSTAIYVEGYNWGDYYYGYGFLYSGNTVIGGTLTDYYGYVNGSMALAIDGLNLLAASVVNLLNNSNPYVLQAYLASGNDIFDLSLDSDVAIAYGGNDTMYGRLGDDHLWGGEGADYIDGGSGFDYARYDFANTGVT